MNFKPGDFVIGVQCVKCHVRVPRMADSSRGKVRAQGNGAMRVTCPSCLTTHDYPMHDLINFVVDDGVADVN